MNVNDLPTPALVVDAAAFQQNVAAMAAVHPGRRLRPHVKAFKSTALARELAAAGHRTFCCATTREVEGMVAAGVGDDLLLANEVLGLAADRLGRTAARAGGAVAVSVAVDSDETVDAAAAARVGAVVIDVNVGLPRCGCDPADAGRLADRARAAGLDVLGVMGYEGHLMRAPADRKAALVEAAMQPLLVAQAAVGGPLVTGGGTGTYAVNRWVDEVQAGSYCLMDTEYTEHAPAFVKALRIVGTCISSGRDGAVLDVGLKALSVDHGPPAVDGADVLLVSDEHLTIGAPVLPRPGDRVSVWPSHVDPTVALHERLNVVDGESVLDVWPVDLRGW